MNFSYHKDVNVLHLNTEENRSYYIPAESESDAIKAISGISERKFELNGKWNFVYFNSLDEATDFGTKELLDIPDKDMDNIPVPSCWQNYNHDRHAYLNLHYPFAFDPPYIPEENPCGLYRRKFVISKKNKRLFLNFEGIDSCCYVFINKKFVGYSQVSHSTSEFEITEYITDGENQIDVLVFKWCDGTYLEDQDKLRMSGIFRDVYIISRPQNFIRDFFVHTDLNENLSICKVYADIELNGNADVFAKLYSPCGKFIDEVKAQNGRVSFKISNPVLWNAEIPKQYTLVLFTDNEYIAQKVGIRRIEVKNQIVLVNNTPIKFLGVNRHDSDPVNGAAVTREQVYKDLIMMKRANINAIRTSHYPNSPWFLQMCSEIGFYVIAEADIEMHGVVTQYGFYNSDPVYSQLAIKPLFKEAVLDRVQRSVIRDKNNAAAVIWSMGNESGYGPNFENAGRWVKSYDNTRLLHYEGAGHADKSINNDFSMLDLYSRMYASVEEVDEYFAKKVSHKPFIQCEFLHAMGNSAGDMEENIEQIYKYDGYCGGFVWEWCDHAMYGGTTPDGQPVYRYGGDFGEFTTDSNFCMDGMVYPNRNPHTYVAEYKNCIRPVRAKQIDSCTYILSNKLSFINIKDFLTISYEIRKDGYKINEGILPEIDIKPLSQTKITIPETISDKENISVIFKYLAKNKTDYWNAGYEIGFDEFILNSITESKSEKISGEVKFNQNSRYINIYNNNFSYEFDKYNGLFSKMCYQNKELFTKPSEWNIWRAPTDNDRTIKKEWIQLGYNRATVKTYSTECEKLENGAIKITCVLSIAAEYIKRIIDVKAQWIVFADGLIKAEIHGERDTDLVYLPRFGVRYFLINDMEKCTYLGYGPFESYVDKHRSSTFGIFNSTVTKMYEPYIMPQENSSHYGCKLIKVYNNYNNLTITADKKTISFNVSHYTQEELTQKNHNYELQKCGSTVLCIDSQMAGIGSGSCGPQLMDKYRYLNKNIDMYFDLKINN